MPIPKRGVAALSDAERGDSSLTEPSSSNPPSGTGRELPEQFGRYRIVQRLGQGGMGSVYLAEDTQLGRRVALKVSDLAGSPEGLKRFEREARALAALDHPSICHVYDYGVFEGVPFLIMAYIAGGSLAESIPDGGMPPQRAAALVHDLAVAMREAHAHGILHRDLKPMNVMMKPTGAGFVPVIVDFGLARRDDSAEEALTATGRGMGTLYYMPLEQINGDRQAIGPACDVYALGIILYELLTGRRPFQGTYAEIVAQKLTHTPESLSTLRAGIDPRLEAVCLKAMAREIGDRYRSMAELAQALADVLNAPTEPFSVPQAPLAETLLLPRDQPPAPPRREGERIVAAPLAKKGWGGSRPPGRRKVAFAASCGGLLLLGIIIYVTTDKGRVKIDLGEQKGPANLVVERDGKKVADITVEPSPPAPVAKSSVPVEPRAAPSSSPASPPSAESNVAPSASAPVKEWTSPFTKMKLALIPAGSYLMGAAPDDSDAQKDEKPQHKVTISRPFYLGVNEVTQYEYTQVMNDNPSHFKDSELLPVETVAWIQAVMFCNTLSEKEGRRPYYKIDDKTVTVLSYGYRLPTVTILGGNGYRLPTEAEWEYACRAPQSAGSATKHPFGDNEADLSSYAWFRGNSEPKTHPVGQKKPNRWGLYDMQGNVWEWCQDFYSADYYRFSPETDPPGPALALDRVFRGGCWLDPPGSPWFCRPAVRGWRGPDTRGDFVGFRLAADQQPSPPTPVAKPSVPVEPRPAPSPSPASPPAAESNVAPSAPAPVKEWTSPFTKMKLVLIPAGSFEMGSPEDDKDASSDEKPRHRVTISRPFYMGVHEVTQDEYERVMGANPSYFKRSDSLPVEMVSWLDAVKFCNALSAKEGLAPFYKIVGDDQVTVLDWNGTGYRLPTEAEWEYACRAGSTTRYSFGDDEAGLGNYAWYASNDDGKTHPVGQKRANAFGLHDMRGNVWEWCWDWYDEHCYKNTLSNIDLKGPDSEDARVVRGGAWDNDASDLRSAYRFKFAPFFRNGTTGLRCVRTYP